MATKGTNANIIVGAAQLFIKKAGTIAPTGTGAAPAFVSGTKYADTLEADTTFRNVGYTSNGLELQFQPDFGEVSVDQVLDAAKLYKQGMTVNMNTSFAEATLENLLVAIAANSDDLTEVAGSVDPDLVQSKSLELLSGNIGDCPLERGLVAVGPGTGDCAVGSELERVYVAYRALSIENVTVSAKRDEATMFDVSFRLLPEDTAGSYGKIVDRTVPAV